MGHESSFKPERLIILEAFLTTRTLRKHNEEEELFFFLIEDLHTSQNSFQHQVSKKREFLERNFGGRKIHFGSQMKNFVLPVDDNIHDDDDNNNNDDVHDDVHDDDDNNIANDENNKDNIRNNNDF